MTYKTARKLYEENVYPALKVYDPFRIRLQSVLEKLVRKGEVLSSQTRGGKTTFEVTPHLEGFIKSEIDRFKSEGTKTSDIERYEPFLLGPVYEQDAATLCGKSTVVSFKLAWKGFIEEYPEYEKNMRTREINGETYYRVTTKTALKEFITFMREAKKRGKDTFFKTAESEFRLERVISKDS